MWKSIQESFRSLWSVPGNDTIPTVGTKRKRDFSPGPIEEHPDIEIVKVEKRRKLETVNPLQSILNIRSKMSDWMKLKSKAFSEQFSTSKPREKTDEKSNSESVPNMNGGALSRRDNGHRNRRYDHAVRQRNLNSRENIKYDFSQASSNHVRINGERRTSSTSLRSKPTHSDTSLQCIRLEEKRDYQNLLRMNSKFSLATSRFPACPKNCDAHSVSSYSSFDSSLLGTSNILSQAHGLPVHTPRKHSSNTELTSTSSFRKSLSTKPPTFATPSMQSLLKEQRRRLGLESQTHNQHQSKSPVTKVPQKAPETVTDQIIILDDDCESENRKETKENGDLPLGSDSNGLPSISYKEKKVDFRDSEYMSAGYAEKFKNSRLMHDDHWRRQVEEEEMKAQAYNEKRRAQSRDLERRLQHQMRIFEEEPEVFEEILIDREESDEEDELPELTDEMIAVVKAVLRPGPSAEVISEGFRQKLTRGDMATLAGLNWLNDEVINFYMNMLMERGEQEGMSKVYAFNTFFYPKIMSGGHSAVKRWTKKVDIFEMHYILIPVHLGMHWCLCVADMKDKKVTYYDSMGGKNHGCLKAVLHYINDESMAKKQQSINTSEWALEIAEDNPQQLNGSDCGMFACKYAEYITRGKNITFTQEHMPYFRQRMVYEIKTKKLLQ